MAFLIVNYTAQIVFGFICLFATLQLVTYLCAPNWMRVADKLEEEK